MLVIADHVGQELGAHRLEHRLAAALEVVRDEAQDGRLADTGRQARQ